MKTILITVLDDDKSDSDTKQWYVEEPDTDGKIRAEIGVWLGQFIGKYRYRTSDWINSRSDNPERHSPTGD